MAQLTPKKKIEFIEAYKRMAGNISAACKSANIPRKTYYNWMKDNEFAEDIYNAYEETIDWAESKLMRQIENDNITAIIFYLKTKGQKRGYVEKQDIGIASKSTEIVVYNDEAKHKLETLKKVKPDAEAD